LRRSQQCGIVDISKYDTDPFGGIHGIVGFVFGYGFGVEGSECGGRGEEIEQFEGGAATIGLFGGG
jgi:hypothetical protein